LQPQNFVFSSGELEHEVRRKFLAVAADLLVEAFDGNAVELCQVGVEDHLLTAQEQYS
jgi:hypothetical protein